MSDSLLAVPFQVSDKWGENIFVVRGDTFAQFVENMVEVFGQAGTDARLLGIQSKQTDSHVITQAVQNARDGGVVNEPAAVNPGKSCPHGQMTKRNGTSAKTGKSWTAWFCPLEKGDPNQCKPEFV